MQIRFFLSLTLTLLLDLFLLSICMQNVCYISNQNEKRIEERKEEQKKKIKEVYVFSECLLVVGKLFLVILWPILKEEKEEKKLFNESKL